MEEILNQLKESSDKERSIVITSSESKRIIDSYDRLKAAFEELMKCVMVDEDDFKEWRIKAGLLPDQKKEGQDAS